MAAGATAENSCWTGRWRSDGELQMELIFSTFKACLRWKGFFKRTTPPSPPQRTLLLTCSPRRQMSKMMNGISNILRSPLQTRIKFHSLMECPLRAPCLLLWRPCRDCSCCISCGLSQSHSQNLQRKIPWSCIYVTLVSLKLAQCGWHCQGWLPAWDGPCYPRTICCILCLKLPSRREKNKILIIFLTRWNFLWACWCPNGSILSIPMQIRSLLNLLISLCTPLSFSVAPFSPNCTFSISRSFSPFHWKPAQ